MRGEVLPCSEETKNEEEETSLFGVHRVIPNICTDPLIKTMHLKCIISVSLVCALHLCVYACDLYLCVCYSPVYFKYIVSIRGSVHCSGYSIYTIKGKTFPLPFS